MITDPSGVFVVLAVVVFLAVWLETKHSIFRSLGAALVGILIGMVLSNLGVIPGESPTYDFLMGPAISVGIALILLSVDVRSIMQAGPMMLAAFLIGAVGTALGAIVGGLTLGSLVGPETWKLAGQYTGTYTGGGVNFAALGQALDTSSDMFTAATAADVIVTAIWMAACLSVPLLFKSRVRPADAGAMPGDQKGDTLEHSLYNSLKAVPLSDAAALVAIAVGAVWLSGLLGEVMPILPDVLWLTTVVLLVAQIPAIKNLTGSALWGNYLLLLFLASNGARSVIANIVNVGPAVFYYALVTVAIHGVIIFGLGWLLRIDGPTLAVASQANVGGAGSAMALAGARGYSKQLLPGVAVSLFGYAVGNYSGFAVASLMRNLIG
jgi:uncharacterized membrane protein